MVPVPKDLTTKVLQKKYLGIESDIIKQQRDVYKRQLNAPDLGMIVAGAIISAIGMLVGSLWNKKRHNQKNN